MLKLATKFAPALSSLETAYRAGFRHAELFLDVGILAEWQTAAGNARYYPNSYVVHFPNRLDLEAEALQAAVSLYREIGCRCMVVHQPMFDKLHDTLLRMEPAIRLAVENHKLTMEGFTDWAERNPALTLDVEHLWKFTLKDGPLDRLLKEMRRFLARHATKLRHVHLPGYWPGFDEHRPMYCSRDMVFPVLSMLEEVGFDGLVVSEVTLSFQNPAELRMDVLLFDVWRGARSHPSQCNS
jgi:hypothetical protein